MNAPDHVELEALLTERDCVRRLVRCLLSDEHAVDDVVQDTWLTAIQKPPRPGRDLRAWLSGVARNLARRRMRSEARRSDREPRAAQPEGGLPASTIVERAAAHRRVVGAVLELGEPYRTAILLRFFEGRTPRQIVRETGINLNTVNSQIQRGLSILKRKLSREFGVERSALAVILLPLLQAQKGLVTGALVMGTKLKIALATALVLFAAIVVYQLSDRDVRPEESTQRSETRGTVATKEPAPKPSKPAVPERAARGAVATDTPPAATPAATPTEVKERETLSGSVRSVTGAPIAGATVRATSPNSLLVRLTLAKPLTTTTDARGHFAFTELDRRLRWLIVEASAEGYFSQQKGIPLGETSEFVLGAPGVVRGRVTSRKDGSPCADAAIFLRCRPSTTTKKPVRGTTNQSGFYRIENLEPGVYAVSILSPEHPPEQDSPCVVVHSGCETAADLTLPAGRTARGRVLSALDGKSLAGATVRVGYPERVAVTDTSGRYELRGLGDQCRVHISAEGHASLRTGLRLPVGEDPATVPDVTLNPLALVRGQVLGSDGTPLPDVEVKGGVQPVHTDASGRFEVHAAASNKPLQLEALKAGLARSLSEPLTLEPGKVRPDVVIRMRRGGRVSGRVVDASGTPVPRGVHVRLDPARGQRIPQQATSAASDGTFAFEAVPAGQYDLVVYATEQDRIGQRRPGLTVTENGELSGLELVLPKGRTISGRVVDEQGLPVPNARVRISSREQGAIPGYKLGRADLDGTFSLTGLVAGQHSVMAEGKDCYQADKVVATDGATDVIVRLKRSPPPVTGVVLLRESRMPVTSFWVRAHGPFDSKLQRFLDTEGRFQLALRQGTYFLEAGTEDGLVSDRAIRVELRRATPPLLELLLVPGVGISGTVRKPDGSPAPVASVTALSVVPAGETAPAVVGRARTDGDGRFEMTSLRPGTVFLTASARDWIETTRQVHLTAGRSTTVDLTLEARGARLRVEVKGVDGKPIEGAKVRLRNEQGRNLHIQTYRIQQLLQKARASDPDLDADLFRRWHFVTNPQGVLTRHFLPAGRCQVEVSKWGYTSCRRQVDLFADQESSVTMVLEQTR